MAASEYFFSSPLADYESFQTYGSFENQIGLIKNLNTLHDDISGSIVTYETKKNDLISNYKDFSSNSIIDPNRMWLDKEDRLPDVSDGVKEDIHIMIMEQNNAYIIGMITLVTVLITTYLVIKK
jgi:hypothetical protein